jgi:hypothetical protein
LIGLEASGIRAFRDSLKKNQHRVCGVVWHAGQGRPANTVILTLPWGWNMVRCGAVSHPSQWQWLGYHEIMDQRQRYRLLDLDTIRLAVACRGSGPSPRKPGGQLGGTHRSGQMKGEARWTESLAVGSRAFVEKVQPLISGRLETESVMTANNIWAIQEAAVPYGQQMEAKIVSRASLER